MAATELRRFATVAAGDLVVEIAHRFPSGFAIDAAFRAPMAPGSITVLFGPSGSGKTTLVRSIAGLDRPHRGAIQFAGETWFDRTAGVCVEPQRRRVGYVFQESALFPHLTVDANIAYGLTPIHPSARASRVGELLSSLGIAELASRYPRQLSGGQAQRAALARALAPRPRLLLLDEPFASLDAPARSGIRSVLRAVLTTEGISAVLVTHDRNEAIALGDHMVVVVDGSVRQVGGVLDVFRRPADLAVARSVGVDSVLPARVERVAGGLVELRVGDASLRAADIEREACEVEVFACIRAEDVVLERTAAQSASARNHLPGRIVAIDSDGPLERVTVDCGFLLTALITRHAREEMSLAEGTAVVAAIKATAVHLVPRA
jgi:molybdate transport system ATP-binding protein